MIIDKFLQVSDDQAVTASAASTDVIDFGQPNPNTGLDDRSNMVFTVSESAAGSGAVTFSVQDSDDNSTFTDRLTSGPVAAADLVAGAQVVVPMPTILKRWCRAYYTVDGTLTGGKFSAQIVAGIQQNIPQPDSPRIT